VEEATGPRSTLTWPRHDSARSRVPVLSAEHLRCDGLQHPFAGTLLIMSSHRRLTVVLGAHVGGRPTNLLSGAPSGCPLARAGRVAPPSTPCDSPSCTGYEGAAIARSTDVAVRASIVLSRRRYVDTPLEQSTLLRNRPVLKVPRTWLLVDIKTARPAVRLLADSKST